MLCMISYVVQLHASQNVSLPVFYDLQAISRLQHGLCLIKIKYNSTQLNFIVRYMKI